MSTPLLHLGLGTWRTPELSNKVEAVLTGCALQGMSEHFHFLDDGKMVVVWCHAKHQPVLHIQRDLPGVSVFSDERMQGISVGHPSDETYTEQ